MVIYFIWLERSSHREVGVAAIKKSFKRLLRVETNVVAMLFPFQIPVILLNCLTNAGNSDNIAFENFLNFLRDFGETTLWLFSFFTLKQ